MLSLVTVGFFQIIGITATVTCVWQRLNGIQETGSGKGPSPGILWLEVIGIEKPEVGLTRSSAFYVTDLGIGMAFSGWSWTGSRGKKKQGSRQSPNKSWVLWSDCCQGCSLASFLKTSWLLQSLWVRVLLSCVMYELESSVHSVSQV